MQAKASKKQAKASKSKQKSATNKHKHAKASKSKQKQAIAIWISDLPETPKKSPSSSRALSENVSKQKLMKVCRL